MRKTRRRTAIAIGVTAAFVLAACGSDDNKASTVAPTTAPAGGTETTAPVATTPTATDAPNDSTEPTTGDSTESTEGSTPSSEAGSSDLGLVDGKYVGSGGFTIDPADCPGDWDPNQGITDTEINLFTSLPKSGPLAGFGLLDDGAQSYFKYINENGGIDGRNIVVTTKDDTYKPDLTKSNVDEALGAKKYAALFLVLGTPNNLAVWDETNDECMPHLLNGTGAAQWGDVKNHPWTTGMQLDYFTEAGLWAKWLQTNHPDLTKVAELTFNSDFGQSYHSGFKFAADGTDLEVIDQELHDPTAPNVTNQFTTLAASGAQVLLLETSGAFCTQAMAEVEKQTTWKPLVIMSGTCASLNQFFKPLIDQGLTGQDTYLIQNYKDVLDPENANDDIVKLYNETLTAQGLDPNVTTYSTGWIFAWYMTEILKDAATYQGGLDRGNIMLAARNIHKDNPLLLNGLTSKTNGEEDAYLTEGGRMAKYTVSDPTQLGKFVQDGDLINLEGKLGTYETVQEASAAG